MLANIQQSFAESRQHHSAQSILSQKKLCKIVFVITSSNFHQFR